ncbi:hypothetical protein CDL12_05601 [Handroanthus impetiginosus]|uniref:Uncharacterized protein n=1 Tax=Handroanthus impetiginosus TaxID=429701 RepID=A0A2G9HVZ0_9LAMI|nr:hypothetical protein CDL12_05601 [Handroanthus impetiginosus]
MSGFFSLGKSQDQHPQTDNRHSLFLFKNEEIYNKSFELWQQQYHLHQQRLHPSHSHNTVQHVDFSIGPSRRDNNNVNGGNNIGNELSNYSNYYRSTGFRVMSQGRGRNDGINCQDCGNQAKKDCPYMRCRTCCKSRGFQCQTHVKSTWVPAAKRRERQQQVVIRGEATKRFREINPGAGGSGGGGLELSNLPPEVNSQAVFRCVRVSAMEEADEHLAYQTAVNIGGHVFKGILYDQGPESAYPSGGGESSSGGGGSQQQPLDLIAAAAATSGATTSNLNATMADPSIYPTQYGGYMAGTQFFLPPRP